MGSPPSGKKRPQTNSAHRGVKEILGGVTGMLSRELSQRMCHLNRGYLR